MRKTALGVERLARDPKDAVSAGCNGRRHWKRIACWVEKRGEPENSSPSCYSWTRVHRMTARCINPSADSKGRQRLGLTLAVESAVRGTVPSAQR